MEISRVRKFAGFCFLLKRDCGNVGEKPVTRDILVCIGSHCRFCASVILNRWILSTKIKKRKKTVGFNLSMDVEIGPIYC